MHEPCSSIWICVHLALEILLYCQALAEDTLTTHLAASTEAEARTQVV
jgi:hypothetical protein